MKIPYLASDFLDSLAKCASLDSAVLLTEAKATEVQSQLAAAGYIVPKQIYMMWYKITEIRASELANECQFILDLYTIGCALKGNWSGSYDRPEYYDNLKNIVFELRNDFLHKKAFEESVAKVSSIYREIKTALSERPKPVIKCIYNIWIEKFIIMFDDDKPEGITKKDWIDCINAKVRSMTEGVGEDTWTINDKFDVQNLRDLVRGDEFQHPEILKMVNSLKMPF